MYQTQHIDKIFEAQPTGRFWEIELSPIDYCNRRCSCCPKSTDKAPNTPIMMDKGLIDKMSTELFDLNFRGLVMLCGYGEPLYHPNIVDIVHAFRFCSVSIVTNGDILDVPLAKRLVDNGCDKILVSCYDPKALTHAQKLQTEVPNIIVRDRTIVWDGLNNRAGSLGGSDKKGLCYYPDYMLLVDSNGDVYPCCQEWERRLKLGNAYQSSLWDIWTGNELKRVRTILAKGDRDLFPCCNCDVKGTLRGERNYVENTKRSV